MNLYESDDYSHHKKITPRQLDQTLLQAVLFLRHLSLGKLYQRTLGGARNSWEPKVPWDVRVIKGLGLYLSHWGGNLVKYLKVLVSEPESLFGKEPDTVGKDY